MPGSGSGRYGGFSSDAYYASGGASHAYGASSASTYDQPEYDEYDAGDDEDAQVAQAPAKNTTSASGPPVADLFSFDDEPTASSTSVAPAAPVASAAPAASAADDFDDFQAAPTPTPSQSAQNDPMFDFLDIKPNTPAAPTAVPSPAAAPLNKAPALSAVPAPQASAPTASAPTASAPKPKPSSSLFDDLWAESRGKPSVAEGSGKKTMAQLAQDQTSNRVWATAKSEPKSHGKNDLFDLL